MVKTKVKLLDEKAALPVRAHESDTGYDLKFIGYEKIEGDVIFFKTGISLETPPGYYCEVVPRSSISKLPLQMANSIGIIDEHYRGEILIPVRVMHNQLGQEIKNISFPSGLVKIFDLKPATMHDIAQLVIARKPQLFQLIVRERVDAVFFTSDSLEETERGDGGFGSTDVQKLPEDDSSLTKSSVRKLKKTQDSV
jgi:dUTPase